MIFYRKLSYRFFYYFIIPVMKKIFYLFILVLLANCTIFIKYSIACPDKSVKILMMLNHDSYQKIRNIDTATFATGCFWCTEAKFLQLRGVIKVVSGYTGGKLNNPSYRQVCTGTTGHAEACNIIYNAAQISYDELLAAFFEAHDPTQLNRQGNDVGTQYRSAIFYHNAAQKQKAAYYINRLNEEHAYKNKIVTEVVPYTIFYKAADDQQNFYNQNPNQRYCKFVIQPELEKFKKVFKGKLKQE